MHHQSGSGPVRRAKPELLWDEEGVGDRRCEGGGIISPCRSIFNGAARAVKGCQGPCTPIISKFRNGTRYEKRKGLLSLSLGSGLEFCKC